MTQQSPLHLLLLLSATVGPLRLLQQFQAGPEPHRINGNPLMDQFGPMWVLI